MGLTLTLKTTPEVPLEAEVLTPDRMGGLRPEDAARLTVLHGNREAALGDFFRVGSHNGEELRLEGDLGRVKLIGAGMTGGRIHVAGDVGLHLGVAMAGGEIVVEGNAGDWVGPEMTGGRIVIKGDAGHAVGSAYRGSRVGMKGGEIVVHGAAGNEVGNTQRNGLIAIGGTCGDFAGVNMLAGTIVVLGEMGIRCGAGMKRGTIVAMRDAERLPTFTYACRYQPGFLRLYLRHLSALGLAVAPEQMTGLYDRWSGDSVELNRGELLVYRG
jgi:formylmethanofuran dehydrogenase subunit C